MLEDAPSLKFRGLALKLRNINKQFLACPRIDIIILLLNPCVTLTHILKRRLLGWLSIGYIHSCSPCKIRVGDMRVNCRTVLRLHSGSLINYKGNNKLMSITIAGYNPRICFGQNTHILRGHREAIRLSDAQHNSL